MDPFIAQIVLFGGNFAPRGWAFCQGQLLSISSNTALFSLIGTFYGGDGRTTFALPDLRGRVPLGVGNGPGLPSYQIGQKGGSPTHTLTVQQLANHNHTATLRAESAAGDSSNPSGRLLGVNVKDADPYASPVPAAEVPMAADSIVVNPNGGNQSFNIMQPFIGMNYIIALVGTFPSRS